MRQPTRSRLVTPSAAAALYGGLCPAGVEAPLAATDSAALSEAKASKGGAVVPRGLGMCPKSVGDEPLNPRRAQRSPADKFLRRVERISSAPTCELGKPTSPF